MVNSPDFAQTAEMYQDALVRRLGIEFKDVSLLRRAFRHRSLGVLHNEQLEFLGDAILYMVIADRIHKQNPSAPVGTLVDKTRLLVENSHLAHVAERMQLGKCLIVGRCAVRDTVLRYRKALADTLEALIGAIYEDGGLEAARAFIDKQIV